MKFEGSADGALDKIGGAPTHLPAEPLDPNVWGFVAQFYADERRLRLPRGIKCIQLYWNRQYLENMESSALVVMVADDAAAHTSGRSFVVDSIVESAICYEYRDDPEDLDEFLASPRLLDSKIGGNPGVPSAYLPFGATYVLQIEAPSEEIYIGWAEMMAFVFRRDNEWLVAHL